MVGELAAVTAVLWLTSAVTTYLWVHDPPPGPPLHDVVHQWVPYRPAWEAYRVPDVLLGGVLLRTLWPLWCRARPALRRILRQYTSLMAFRLLLLVCTQLPEPSQTCAAGQLQSGQTCGDMMFSGHTVPFVLVALSWRDLDLGPGGCVYAACALGLASLVVLRLHYTIDVLVGMALTALQWNVAPGLPW
jgi:hypothetical protein